MADLGAEKNYTTKEIAEPRWWKMQVYLSAHHGYNNETHSDEAKPDDLRSHAAL